MKVLRVPLGLAAIACAARTVGPVNAPSGALAWNGPDLNGKQVSAQALYASDLGIYTPFRFFSYAQAGAGIPIRLGNRRQFRILPGVSFYVPLANSSSRAEHQAFMPFTIQFGVNFAYAPGPDIDE